LQFGIRFGPLNFAVDCGSPYKKEEPL